MLRTDIFRIDENQIIPIDYYIRLESTFKLDNLLHKNGIPSTQDCEVITKNKTLVKSKISNQKISKVDSIVDYPNGDHYKGQIKDGMAWGFGEAKIGDLIIKSYWEKGVIDGISEIIYPNGDRLSAYIKNGILKGNTIITYSDGRVGKINFGEKSNKRYEGYVKYGIPNFINSLEQDTSNDKYFFVRYKNGDHYFGEIKYRYPHGKGIFNSGRDTTKFMDFYEGYPLGTQAKIDEYNQMLELEMESGTEMGEKSSLDINPYKVFKNPENDVVYDGVWNLSNGQDGKGKIIFPCGTIFQGRWQNAVQQGHGYLYSLNNDKKQKVRTSWGSFCNYKGDVTLNQERFKRIKVDFKESQGQVKIWFGDGRIAEGWSESLGILGSIDSSIITIDKDGNKFEGILINYIPMRGHGAFYNKKNKSLYNGKLGMNMYDESMDLMPQYKDMNIDSWNSDFEGTISNKYMQFTVYCGKKNQYGKQNILVQYWDGRVTEHNSLVVLMKHLFKGVEYKLGDQNFVEYISQYDFIQRDSADCYIEGYVGDRQAYRSWNTKNRNLTGLIFKKREKKSRKLLFGQFKFRQYHLTKFIRHKKRNSQIVLDEENNLEIN